MQQVVSNRSGKAISRPIGRPDCHLSPYNAGDVFSPQRSRKTLAGLVDGRFRVACALEALARCQPHTVLLFHDFWNRTPYHPVLAFTDWLGSCDSLALLRRKASIDATHFEAVRHAHRLNPQ